MTQEKLNERNSQQTSGRAGGYKSCPKSLPESVNLKQQSDCHVCPNAVWFTESMDSQDPTLSVYCQIFRSVIWQSNYRKENITVRMCDGIMIDNSQSQE